MRLVIPGREALEVRHVVLDMNGTITLDGTLVEEVVERLVRLKDGLQVWILTADTFGRASQVRELLGVETTVLEPGREAEQKAAFVRRLGADQSIAIGNGANDVLMLKESAIGICVVGREGASGAALAAADVVVCDVCDALDLLLNPRRLAATLRS
jgi:P-type E1-E2 ATPase